MNPNYGVLKMYFSTLLTIGSVTGATCDYRLVCCALWITRRNILSTWTPPKDPFIRINFDASHHCMKALSPLLRRRLQHVRKQQQWVDVWKSTRSRSKEIHQWSLKNVNLKKMTDLKLAVLLEISINMNATSKKFISGTFPEQIISRLM